MQMSEMTPQSNQGTYVLSRDEEAELDSLVAQAGGDIASVDRELEGHAKQIDTTALPINLEERQAVLLQRARLAAQRAYLERLAARQIFR
jgi:hypothetical protein